MIRFSDSRLHRNARLYFFYWLIAFVYLTLVFGLAWRQLFLGEEYHERGEQQSLRRILQPAPRGDVYDRHGRLLIANRPRFSAVIYLDESLRADMRRAYLDLVREERERMQERGESLSSGDRAVLDWQARAQVMQHYLDEVNAIIGRDEEIDIDELRRHFGQSLILPFPLVKDLKLDEYARLVEQLSPESPVQIYTDTARYYPQGSLAAHTLGYVGSTEEVPREGVPGEKLMTFSVRGKEGRTGIEKAFDEQLRGASGGEVWRVNPAGYQYRRLLTQTPERGDRLVTSLDVDLQRAAEEALGDKTGAVVALEVQTGEVLVLASKPDYDLNDLSPYMTQETKAEIDEKGAWLNRATQGLYPPGSTFKLVTAVAALRNDIIHPETESFCAGVHRVGNRNFPCHNRAGHGQTDLRRAIEKSCNVYFYEHGVKTGIDNIAREARRFHLDEPTGIELPYETSRALVPDPEWKRERGYGSWFPGDTANTSIGQGFLLVTPLRMATFAASLARGWTETNPTLLHKPGRTAAEAGAGGEPIDLPPGDYQAILEGMVAAVETGTARFAQVEGVAVAGKTGTAQVRIEGRPTTLAWFLGFAPVENPQIAVVVVVEGTEPGDSFAGGKTAAPIARAVLERYFQGLAPAGVSTGVFTSTTTAPDGARR